MSKIAFLGTSHTYGYCEDIHDIDERYFGSCYLRTKKQYYNFGYNGATNKDIKHIC